MHQIIEDATRTLMAMALAFISLRLPAAENSRIPAELEFPHVVPVETWRAEEGFRQGDGITISVVRGDRMRIEPGGTYLVQGTYRLNSAPNAMLALSLTTRANGGRSAWADSQRRKIERGSGTFSLVATMQASGRYHVSFYLPEAAGNSRLSAQGGIYFDNR